MLISFGILAPTELIVVLVVALIIFGPGKLPELGKSLGRGINEFKTASQEPIRIVESIGTEKDTVKGNVNNNINDIPKDSPIEG
ncbi:twin-arginine translocase TatA/TatE family subunit [Desulfosporosinus sp. FKB]|uniref:twin-arginine translocase TatA/TatE family subunit n=1 Tax=Desulfosporosinus sp. FKB TaxID=1969835 RepID=UPI000B49EC56|nr:twin-arginine translocase TatA/TatE family subunit [Desulfosporosinus sp. FKB]